DILDVTNVAIDDVTECAYALSFTFFNYSFTGIYLSPGLEHTHTRCIQLLKKVMPSRKDRAARNHTFLGDFNMRLGALTGDHLITARGKHVTSFLNDEGYKLERFSNPEVSTF